VAKGYNLTGCFSGG
jgi:hypothetical protein